MLCGVLEEVMVYWKVALEGCEVVVGIQELALESLANTNAAAGT